MNPLRQAVASVLRLVSVGLLLLGFAVLAVVWATGRHGEVSFLRWIGGSISLLAGIVLLVKSSALAKFLTQDYD